MPTCRVLESALTTIRRGRSPLLALVATLGYSRASYVRFTSGEDAQTLCECLREAFIYFSGTPEQVLFDVSDPLSTSTQQYSERGA